MSKPGSCINPCINPCIDRQIEARDPLRIPSQLQLYHPPVPPHHPPFQLLCSTAECPRRAVDSWSEVSPSTYHHHEVTAHTPRSRLLHRPHLRSRITTSFQRSQIPSLVRNPAAKTERSRHAQILSRTRWQRIRQPLRQQILLRHRYLREQARHTTPHAPSLLYILLRSVDGNMAGTWNPPGLVVEWKGACLSRAGTCSVRDD